MCHVTFTVWLTVMLKVRVEPSVSLTGEGGAEDVMLGGPDGLNPSHVMTRSITVFLSELLFIASNPNAKYTTLYVPVSALTAPQLSPV